MGIIEKFIYAALVFVGSYVVLWLTLDLFEITSGFNAHLIGGIVATVLSVALFMYLLIVKKELD